MAILLRTMMKRGGHRVVGLVAVALAAWGGLAACASILGIESFSPAGDAGDVSSVDAARDARVTDARGGEDAGDAGSVNAVACIELSSSSACASCAVSSCANQLSSLSPDCNAYLECICGSGNYDASAVEPCQGTVTGPCTSALMNVGECIAAECPACAEDAGSEEPDGAPFVALPCREAILGDGGSCISFDEASSSDLCSTMFPSLTQGGFEALGPWCDDAGSATSWAFICCPPACGGGASNDCPSPLVGEKVAAQQCQSSGQTLSGWLYTDCDGSFSASTAYTCCPP